MGEKRENPQLAPSFDFVAVLANPHDGSIDQLTDPLYPVRCTNIILNETIFYGKLNCDGELQHKPAAFESQIRILLGAIAAGCSRTSPYIRFRESATREVAWKQATALTKRPAFKENHKGVVKTMLAMRSVLVATNDELLTALEMLNQKRFTDTERGKTVEMMTPAQLQVLGDTAMLAAYGDQFTPVHSYLGFKTGTRSTSNKVKTAA